MPNPIPILAFIFWTICGFAGIQIDQIRGREPALSSFWIPAIFGPFGLIYLSLRNGGTHSSVSGRAAKLKRQVAQGLYSAMTQPPGVPPSDPDQR